LGCGLSEDDTDKMRFEYDYSNIQDGWGWVKKGIALERTVTGGHFRPPASSVETDGHTDLLISQSWKIAFHSHGLL